MPKLFQCTICQSKFSREDVKQLKYFPSTSVCEECYKEAQEDRDVCFGKKKQFDRHNLACKKFCADRKVCKLFIRIEHAG
jgi:hypothetical protein